MYWTRSASRPENGDAPAFLSSVVTLARLPAAARETSIGPAALNPQSTNVRGNGGRSLSIRSRSKRCTGPSGTCKPREERSSGLLRMASPNLGLPLLSDLGSDRVEQKHRPGAWSRTSRSPRRQARTVSWTPPSTVVSLSLNNGRRYPAVSAASAASAARRKALSYSRRQPARLSAPPQIRFHRGLVGPRTSGVSGNGQRD